MVGQFSLFSIFNIMMAANVTHVVDTKAEVGISQFYTKVVFAENWNYMEDVNLSFHSTVKKHVRWSMYLKYLFPCFCWSYSWWIQLPAFKVWHCYVLLTHCSDLHFWFHIILLRAALSFLNNLCWRAYTEEFMCIDALPPFIYYFNVTINLIESSISTLRICEMTNSVVLSSGLFWEVSALSADIGNQTWSEQWEEL